MEEDPRPSYESALALAKQEYRDLMPRQAEIERRAAELRRAIYALSAQLDTPVELEFKHSRSRRGF